MDEHEERQRIFDLRAQKLSQEKIAKALGTTKGHVRAVLDVKGDPAARVTGLPDRAISASAKVAERPEVIEAEVVAVIAEQRARARRAEREIEDEAAQREIVQRADPNTAVMLTLVKELVSPLRDEIARLRAQPAPAPTPDPLRALADGLGTLAQVQQQVTALAPVQPAHAVTASDIELTVAMERIRIESAAITEKAASEARRNDMFTKAMEQSLPMIMGALQNWWQEERNKPKQPALSVVQGGGQAQLGPTPVPQIMTCANCGAGPYQVIPEPGEIMACPKCGGPLQGSKQEKQTARDASIPRNWPQDATFG